MELVLFGDSGTTCKLSKWHKSNNPGCFKKLLEQNLSIDVGIAGQSNSVAEEIQESPVVDTRIIGPISLFLLTSASSLEVIARKDRTKTAKLKGAGFKRRCAQRMMSIDT